MVTEEAVIQKKLHGSSRVFSLFTGPLGMVDDGPSAWVTAANHRSLGIAKHFSLNYSGAAASHGGSVLVVASTQVLMQAIGGIQKIPFSAI